MARKEMSRTNWYPIAMTLIFGAVLAACTPEGQAQETKPAVTQTIDDLDSIPTVTNTVEILKTNTPENTPTVTATATPEITTTPEAMTQAEIRAEILAAGVNLDDLANSRDEWTSSYMYLEDLQKDIDNNFGKETESFINTVVIGLEAVENLEELEQAVTTDGGWKLTTFAKLAYKDVNGDWQIIKVPLNAYHPEHDLFWIKNVSTHSGSSFMEGEKLMNPDTSSGFNFSPINTWIAVSTGQGYHYGTGSFIELFTAWVENPRYANNDAVLGEYRDPPRYSEEQLIEFRKTGDPSIFGYQDSDGYYIFWPIVTFNADISQLSNYNQD